MMFKKTALLMVALAAPSVSFVSQQRPALMRTANLHSSTLSAGDGVDPGMAADIRREVSNSNEEGLLSFLMGTRRVRLLQLVRGCRITFAFDQYGISRFNFLRRLRTNRERLTQSLLVVTAIWWEPKLRLLVKRLPILLKNSDFP